MKNIAWKRKMKEENLAVFLSQRSVKFHSWNVKTLWKSRSSIYSEEIKNTWELSRDGNHVIYHRQENCFFTDHTEKNQEQKLPHHHLHQRNHHYHYHHDHQHTITTADIDWLFLVPGTAQTSLRRIRSRSKITTSTNIIAITTTISTITSIILNTITATTTITNTTITFADIDCS